MSNRLKKGSCNGRIPGCQVDFVYLIREENVFFSGKNIESVLNSAENVVVAICKDEEICWDSYHFFHLMITSRQEASSTLTINKLELVLAESGPCVVGFNLARVRSTDSDVQASPVFGAFLKIVEPSMVTH